MTEQREAVAARASELAMDMLHAQQDIGCVPAPTKEQRDKAWAEAEELVRVEP